ncbi:MAG: U32 family peptidase [Promethearchaeota archaeon]
MAKLPVIDVYGTAPHSVVGSGRPSVLLKDIDEEEIIEHINKVHKNKMTFSYVLNAPCMNNMEYDPYYHKELLKLLQWISDIGADNVIVTIPLLIQLIKEQFPKLKVRVSTISHVNSVNRAKFYESLGADEITPDVMINRDFKTLEKIRENVKCKIVLLLTDGCLYQCPFRIYHYNTLGHASQSYQQFERRYIETCVLNCSLIKFSDPTEAIKCRWVRPEDLSHYEAIGINNFKIAGRIMPTSWIVRSVKAFSSRKYEGNLIDIIEGFSNSVPEGLDNVSQKGFKDTLGKEYKSKLYIDNTKLNGFIDFFKKQNCIAMCDDCNYCAEWAKKAVYLDKEEASKYVESVREYMEDILTSREFGVASAKPKKEKKTELPWNPETAKIFSEIIKLIPLQFQSLARMTISSLAEEKTRKKNSQEVNNQEMVEAFIEGTPSAFQASMREGLEKYGLITCEVGVESIKPKEEQKAGLSWNLETAKLFDELVKLTPPQFQSIAKMAISSLAEEKAKKRSSQEVNNQDMIEAFMEGTPSTFQATMREGLKKYGLLND